MSIESTLYSIVAASVPIVAAMPDGSSPPAPKFYPSVVPQGVEMPAAVYRVVGGMPANVFDRAPADNARVQIDVYAIDSDQAEAIADLIRAALEDEDLPVTYEIGAKCVGFNGNFYESDTLRYRSSSDWSFWQSR